MTSMHKCSGKVMPFSDLNDTMDDGIDLQMAIRYRSGNIYYDLANATICDFHQRFYGVEFKDLCARRRKYS